jgi:hypothetical protein
MMQHIGFVHPEAQRSFSAPVGVAPLSAGAAPADTSLWKWMVTLSCIAGAGALAYHGYKRHNSTGAAIGWGILGAIFPLNIVAGGIAVGQGFSKRKGRKK